VQQALHDSDDFRRKRLYKRDVHEVLSKYRASLNAIFDYYSAGADSHVITTEGKVMSQDEWDAFLADAGLVGVDHGSTSELTKEASELAFVWSQTFVTDEIKRREKMIHLTFTDFLEALARLCTFKPLPTSELLGAMGVFSCATYFEKAKELNTTIDGIDEALVLPPLDWTAEEVSTSALGPTLEMLILLILERLDANCDGIVTRKELKTAKSKNLIAA